MGLSTALLEMGCVVVLVPLIGLGCGGRTQQQPAATSADSSDTADSVLLNLTSWKGLEFEVEVRGTQVHYRCGPGSPATQVPSYSAPRTRSAAFSLEPEQAQALFEDLQTLDVLTWQSMYSEPHVLHGDSWRLSARIGRRSVDSYGYNAQPAELTAVVERIAGLLGRRPFGFSGCVPDPPDDCLLFAGALRSGVCDIESGEDVAR